MQKRNLIVFDIDGTLTDTVEIHHSAFNKSLKYIGIEKFNDTYGTYTHHTDSHIAKVIFEHALNRTFEKSILELFESYLYNEINLSVINEIIGSKKIVNEIEAKTNFGVCYATGSLLKPAMLKLESIGIDYDPLQLVASNDIEVRDKIVAKAISNAQEYYQVEKFDRIISFGDGLWDLKAAKNLSLEFIGIGNTNYKILKENGMMKHYSDFQKLILSEI